MESSFPVCRIISKATNISITLMKYTNLEFIFTEILTLYYGLVQRWKCKMNLYLKCLSQYCQILRIDIVTSPEKTASSESLDDDESLADDESLDSFTFSRRNILCACMKIRRRRFPSSVSNSDVFICPEINKRSPAEKCVDPLKTTCGLNWVQKLNVTD